jgi:hypothetical protein
VAQPPADPVSYHGRADSTSDHKAGTGRGVTLGNDVVDIEVDDEAWPAGATAATYGVSKFRTPPQSRRLRQHERFGATRGQADNA